MGSDVDAVTKSGRLFHTRAAATGKARSPTVDSRDGGTTSAGVDGAVRDCTHYWHCIMCCDGTQYCISCVIMPHIYCVKCHYIDFILKIYLYFFIYVKVLRFDRERFQKNRDMRFGSNDLNSVFERFEISVKDLIWDLPITYGGAHCCCSANTTDRYVRRRRYCPLLPLVWQLCFFFVFQCETWWNTWDLLLATRTTKTGMILHIFSIVSHHTHTHIPV